MKQKYLFFSFLFILGGFVTTVTSAGGKLEPETKGGQFFIVDIHA